MNHDTGKWYDYNDSSVSELMNPNEAISPAAYVLYYIRKDFYPDGNINYEDIKRKIDDPVIMAELTGKQSMPKQIDDYIQD